MSKRYWHYYEAHINLDEMSEPQEEMLQEVLDKICFKTTDIVALPYENMEQEDFYKIVTTQDKNLKNLIQRVSDSVNLLMGLGYKVKRYKIESTVFDSKYEDQLNLL
jgi:1,2-phenylacetyl-CoA epoxidase catalytic subunit